MKIINSFLKSITRPKFIISLIILILVAIFIGVMVPQVSDKSPSYFEEWKLKSPWTFYIVNLLQLNRVYTSAWFLLLVFIVLLSLGYSLYLQIKRNIKVHSKEVHSSRFTVHSKEVHSSQFTADDLIKFMRKKGYKEVHGSQFTVHSNKEVHGSQFTVHGKDVNSEPRTVNGELLFSKNSINRWGGVIFHSGLFLIIVAALIGLSFQKRGFVQVMEGEVFSGSDSDFLVKDMGLFQKRFDMGFKTHLSRFRHEYWDTGQIKQISSSVVLIDGENRYENTIAVNSSVRHKGINIYQSSNYGYALSFIIRKTDGEETITHFMLDRPDSKTKPFIGKSDFPQTPYIFEMKFYPDISMNSYYLGKPILYLKVTKDSSQVHGSQFTVHGKDVNSEPRTVNGEPKYPVFEGLVIPGNVMNIEGNLVRFYGISQWSGLIYVRSIDMTIAYIGFIISCVGAAIIFLLPQKEIFISQKGSVLSLYGRTNRYKPLFEEEMERIKSAISSQFTVHSSQQKK